MPVSKIALTASDRQRLYSLRNVENLQDKTNRNLTTGRKVNDVDDDLYDFFRARSLYDRSSDYNFYKSDIDQAISLVKESTDTLESVDKLLKTQKAILNQVLSIENYSDEENIKDLQEFTEQFRETGIQIMLLSRDAHYNGINLLDNSETVKVARLNDEIGSVLRISAKNILEEDADLGAMYADGVKVYDFTRLRDNNFYQVHRDTPSLIFFLSNFEHFSDLVAANPGNPITFTKFGPTVQENEVAHQMVEAIDRARKRLKLRANSLAYNIALLQVRLDFTTNSSNEFVIGGDKLTLADQNEEGVFLVALNTRQEIALNALAISGNQQRAILQLLR